MMEVECSLEECSCQDILLGFLSHDEGSSVKVDEFSVVDSLSILSTLGSNHSPGS